MNLELAVAQNLSTVTGSSGLAKAIDNEGDLIYVGAGSQLFILDAEDVLDEQAEKPIWQAALTVPGSIDQIAIHKVTSNKIFAYLSLGANGFGIADVSQPNAPKYVSTLAQIGPSNRFFFDKNEDEDHVYIAGAQGGWHIINIENESSPIVLSSQLVNFPVACVYVHRKKAYVVTKPDGLGQTSELFIYDVTQKTSPTLQSVKVDIEESVQDSVKLNGLAQRIVVRRLDNQKTLAYVALGKRGLHILNVTDIKNIIVNQNLTGITEAIDIALDENNWLYVSDEYIGLHVFEDAKNLDTIGNYSPSNFISRPTVAFSVSSTSKRADLYVVDGLNHAMVLKQDLESKTPWQLIGNWRTVGVVESAIFFRTDSKGTIATANGQNGVSLFTVESNNIKSGDVKSSNQFRTFVDVGSSVSSLTYNQMNGLLYILSSNLTLIDPKQNNKILHQLPLAKSAKSLIFVPSSLVTTSSTLTYLSTDLLEVYDFDTPTTPQLITTVPISNIEDQFLFQLEDKTLICLACGADGLKVLDVTQPTQPNVISTYQTVADGFSRTVEVVDQIAFVSDSYGGLWIVDLAEPAQPTEITRLRTDSVVQDLTINGEFVFLATATRGIQVVDASILHSPKIVKNYLTLGSALSIFEIPRISNSDIQQILVGDASNGAQILSVDLLVPRSPIITGLSPRAALPEKRVTISGRNFNVDATVLFGNLEVPLVEWISEDSIQAFIPKDLKEGLYDLAVVNPDQASSELPSRLKIVGKQAEIFISALTDPDQSLARIDFNSIPLGSKTPPIFPLQIKNNGTASLEIKRIDLPSRKFTIQSSEVLPLTINPDKTELITLRFEPTTILKLEDMVTFHWKTSGQETVSQYTLPVGLTVTGKTESFTILGVGRHLTIDGESIVETAYVDQNYTVEVKILSDDGSTVISSTVSPVRSITNGSAYTYITSIDPRPETGYAPIEIGQQIELSIFYHDPTILSNQFGTPTGLLNLKVDGQEYSGETKIEIKEKHLANREISIDFGILFPKPKVTDITRLDSINPNLADPSGGGGTPLRLHGLNFRPGLELRIQTGLTTDQLTLATEVERVSDNELRALTPIGLPGTDRSVVIINVDGQESSLTNSPTYTYNSVDRISILDPDATVDSERDRLLFAPILTEGVPFTLPISTTKTLQAIGFDKNGYRLALQDTTWEIVGNARGGGIAPNDGKLTTGPKKGDFRIRVTYTTGGINLTATQPITVTAGAPTKIIGVSANPTQLTASTENKLTHCQITVHVTDQQGNPVSDLKMSSQGFSSSKSLNFKAKYSEIESDLPQLGQFSNFISNGDGNYQITYTTPNHLELFKPGISGQYPKRPVRLSIVVNDQIATKPPLNLYPPVAFLTITPKRTIILDLSSISLELLSSLDNFRAKIQQATQLAELNKELKSNGLPIFQPLLMVTENRSGDFLESVPVTYMGNDRYEVLDSSKIQPAPSRSNSSVFITGLSAYKDFSKDVKWQVVPDVISEQLFRLPADGTTNKKFIVHGIDNLGSFVTHKTPILIDGFTQKQVSQEELQISTTVGRLVDENVTDTGYEFVYLASTTQQRKVRIKALSSNANGQIDLQLVSGETANITLQFANNNFLGGVPQLPADGKSKITFQVTMTDRYRNPVILSEPYNNPVSRSSQIEVTLQMNEEEAQFYFPRSGESTENASNLGTIQNFVDLQNGSYTAEYVAGSRMGTMRLQVKNGDAIAQASLSILLGEKAELQLINVAPYRMNYQLEQNRLFPKGYTPVAGGDIIPLWLVVRDANGNSVSGLRLTVDVDKGQTDEVASEKKTAAADFTSFQNDDWKYPPIKDLYRVNYNPPKTAEKVKVNVIAEDPKSVVTPPLRISKIFELPVVPNRPDSNESTIEIGRGQQMKQPPSDGTESTLATVIVRDKHRNVVPNQKLQLVIVDQPTESTPTIIPLPKSSQQSTASTNEDGQASFELKMKYDVETASDNVLKVKAELVDGDSAFQPLTALVPFSSPKIAEIEFTQLPLELRGNGISEGEILLKVKNEVGIPLSNADIWVNPSEGEIVGSQVISIGNGIYRCMYRSTDRMTTIVLEAGSKSDIYRSNSQPKLLNNEFDLLAGDVSPSNSTVEISDSTILANSKSRTAVDITLLDGSKEENPIQGQSIVLSVPDHSDKVIIEQPLPTNSKGQTTGYIQSAVVHRLGQDVPLQIEVKVLVQPINDQGQTVVLSGNRDQPLTFYLVPPSPKRIDFTSIKYQNGTEAEWLNAKGPYDEDKSQVILEIQVLDKAGDPVEPLEPTMYLMASAGQIPDQAEYLGSGIYQAIFTSPSYPDDRLEIRAKIADLANQEKAWLEFTQILTVRKTDIIPPTIEKAETINSKEILLRFNEPVFGLLVDNWSVDENRIDQIIPQFQFTQKGGSQEFRLILVAPISPQSEPMVAYQTLVLPVNTDNEIDDTYSENLPMAQDLIGAVQDLSGNFLSTVSIKAQDKILPDFQAQITGANQILLTFNEPVIGFRPDVYLSNPDNGNHIGWKIQSGEFKKEMANFVTNFEPLDSTASEGYRLWQVDFRPEYDPSIPWFLPLKPNQIPNQIRFEYQPDPTSAQFQPQTDLSGNPISGEPVIATFKELPAIIVLDTKGNQLEKTLSVSEGQTIDLEIIVTNERFLTDEISFESSNELFIVNMPIDNEITIESAAPIYTSLSDYKSSLSETGKLDWVDRLIDVLGGSGKNFWARNYSVTFGHNIATASTPKKVYPFVLSVEDKNFPNQSVRKELQFEVNNRSLAAMVEIVSERKQLVADGIDKTPLTVTITDSIGAPVEDEQVTLVTDDGREFKTYYPSPYVRGHYQGVYITKNDQIGDVIITARTSVDGVSAQIKLDHLPEQPDSVHLTITDSELPADGNSTTRLIVTLRDKKKRPIDSHFAYLDSTKNPQSPTLEIQEVEVRFDPPPKYGRIWSQTQNLIDNMPEVTDDDEIDNMNSARFVGGLTGKHLAFYQAPNEFLPDREAVKIVAKVTVFDPKKGSNITMSGAASVILYKPNRLPKLTIKGPLSEISGETLPTPLYENDELKLELIVEDPDQDPVNLYAENLPSGATLTLPTEDNQNAKFEWKPTSQLVKAEEKEKPFTITFHASDGRGGSVSRKLNVVVKHLSSAKQISLFATPNRLVVGQSEDISSATIRAIVSDRDGIRQPFENLRMMSTFTPDPPALKITNTDKEVSLSLNTESQIITTDLTVIEEEVGVYRAVFSAGTSSGQVSVTAQIEGTNTKSKPVILEVLPDSLSTLLVSGPLVKKPNPIQLEAGESEFFTIWGQDKYYNPVPIPRDEKSSLQWAIVGNIGQVMPEEPMASEFPYRRFQFIAESVGQGEITWSISVNNTKIEQKTDKIKVSPGQLDRVIVEMTQPENLSASIPIGQELTFEAKATDAFGNTISLVKDEVSWSVLNDIGDLDTDSQPTSQPIAVFSPRRIGKGLISANVGKLQGQSAPISVVAGSLDRIEIKPIEVEYQSQDPIETLAGDQIQFSVRGFDSTGNSVPIPNAFANWQIVRIDDNNEMSVGIGTYETLKNGIGETMDPSGIYNFRATTVGLGRIDLTFKPPMGNTVKSQSSEINVSSGPVHSLSIEPKNPTVIAGEEIKFRIIPQDSYGNSISFHSNIAADSEDDQPKSKEKIEISLELVIPSNNLEPIAEILEGYRLKAKKTGIGQVKARLIRSETESLPLHKRTSPIESYAPITVVAGPVVKVEVHPKEDFSVEVGKIVNFQAIGLDALNNPVPLNTGLKWTLDHLEGRLGEIDQEGKVEVNSIGKSKITVNFTDLESDEEAPKILTGSSGELSSGMPIPLQFTKTQRPKTIVGAGLGKKLTLPISAQNVPLPFQLLKGSMVLSYPLDLLQFDKVKVVGDFTVQNQLIQPGQLSLMWDLKLSPATRQEGAPVHFVDLAFTVLPTAKIGAISTIESISLQLQGSKGLIPSNRPRVEFHLLPDVLVDLVMVETKNTNPLNPIPINTDSSKDNKVADNSTLENYAATVEPNEVIVFDLRVDKPNPSPINLASGQINIKSVTEIASFDLMIDPLYQPSNNEIAEDEQVLEQKPMIRIKPISKGQALVIEDWDIAFGNSTYQAIVAQLKLTISPDAAARSFPLPITSNFASKQGDIFGLKMSSSELLVLDNRPPTGEIIINNGRTHTNQLTVELTLSVTDSDGEVTEMLIVNTWQDPIPENGQIENKESKDAQLETWIPFANKKEWKLTEEDEEGEKFVYGQFKDQLENLTKPPLIGKIIYDTTPPIPAIQIPSLDLKKQIVTIEMQPEDNLSNMLIVGKVRLSNVYFDGKQDKDSQGEPLEWLPVKKEMEWKLSTGSGRKTVYVQFRDPAGNLSKVISEEADVDVTPPEIVEFSPNDEKNFVPVNALVTITFNEIIDEESLTNSKMEVIGLSTTGSNETVYKGSLGTVGSTIQFLPDNTFSNLTEISVRFKATVIDQYQNPIVQEKEWAFSTGLGVWPGDTNNDGVVDILDIIPIGLYWKKQTIVRESRSLMWLVQPARPAVSIDELTEEKIATTFADADGDGLISASDIVPIAQNWAKTHQIQNQPSNVVETAPASWPKNQQQLAEQFNIYEQMLHRLEKLPDSEGILQLRQFLGKQISRINQQLIPHQTQLLANYPNPFNPETWMPYQLAKDGVVVLIIYNTLGEVVRSFNLGYQTAGYYLDQTRAVHWNGKNRTGESVTSGLYFYQIQVESGKWKYTDARKLVLVK